MSRSEAFLVTRAPRVTNEILSGKEVKLYLDQHPELLQYLKRFEKAQKTFGKFLRLTGSQKIVRDLAPGSTSEVDLNGAVSRTNL